MGTSSCIAIIYRQRTWFRVVLIRDGGININPSLAVGDHILEFLRDGGKREALKSRMIQLIPREMDESKNDKWVEDNFGNHRGNILEPLLDMLQKGSRLEVPNVTETSHNDYYYEIDFDQNQLSINCHTNEVQIFDLNSLPSSQEISDRIQDTSRRVDIDWREIEKAIGFFDTACQRLYNASLEMRDARISCKKVSKRLYGVYNDLVEQNVL